MSDGKIQLLTLEEEGVYQRLKSYCWIEGSVPADLAKLFRLRKGCSVGTLEAVVALCEFDSELNVLKHKGA